MLSETISQRLAGPGPICTVVPPAKPLPTLADDVRAGLLEPPRSLPPKYFYDNAGSRLFERICATPEYYPSRTEERLLSTYAGRIMADAVPRHLVELGSGSSRKTRRLLDAWPANGGCPTYWPFDVCEEMLADSGRALVDAYPWLAVRALVGDYTGGVDRLPLPSSGRRLVAFLGGTIGNFEPGQAEDLLRGIAALLRPGDRLLLGADRVKDPATLEAAYNDARGITARFNKNVLRVLNRELDADFPLDAYRHRAFYDAEAEWVEMRLVSNRRHRVRLGRLDHEIEIDAGEEIRTEISRKFTKASLAALLSAAGMSEVEHFEAPGGTYSLVLAAPS